MKYEVGNWYGWSGGECPVHPDTIISVKWSKNGVETEPGPARQFLKGHWGYSGVIAAFTIIREHREPREFWAVEVLDGAINTYETERYARARAQRWGGTAFLVREVIDEPNATSSGTDQN